MKIKLWFVVVAGIVIALIAFTDRAKAEMYRLRNLDMTFENPSVEVIAKLKELQAILTDLKPYAIKPSEEENPTQAKIHICHNDIQHACSEGEEIDKVDIDKTIEDKQIETKATEIEVIPKPSPTKAK